MNEFDSPPQASKNDSTAQVFSIIGFVLAILSLIFSLIPCIGFYALIPSILAAIFSFVAMRQQKIAREQTGLSLAGLLIGIVALLISVYQYMQFKPVFDNKEKSEKNMDKFVEKIFNEAIEQGMKRDSIERAQNDSLSEIDPE